MWGFKGPSAGDEPARVRTHYSTPPDLVLTGAEWLSGRLETDQYYLCVYLQPQSPNDDPTPRPSQRDPHPHTRPLPFHALPLDFGLDYVDFLDPAQLALAWIAHPDYDDMVKRPLHKAWSKARKEAQAAGKVGAVAVGPGERGDWPDLAAIDLDWPIPIDLDQLPSEHLAVSMTKCLPGTMIHPRN